MSGLATARVPIVAHLTAPDPNSCRPSSRRRKAAFMTQFVPEDHSHARLERLLRGAHDAAMLRHRLALMNIEAQHRLAWHRTHFDPNQPRVPAGHSDGGQWTRIGSAKGTDRSQVLSDVTPGNDWEPGAQYANARRPGTVPVRIGGQWFDVELGQANRLFMAEARAQVAIARVRELDPNWRPTRSMAPSVEGQILAYEAQAEQAQARLRELTRFQVAPIIPRERPPTAQERNGAARELARWLLKNQGQVAEGAHWLFEYQDAIQAHLDPPRTLEELQDAVSNPKKGYDIHHIVEKMSAEADGFPKSVIHGPENLVRIPKFKHWEITGWHMTKSKNYGGLPPREYLRGKDWATRMQIGIDALILHGVLKP
jgi:hypothetical protein